MFLETFVFPPRAVHILVLVQRRCCNVCNKGVKNRKIISQSDFCSDVSLVLHGDLKKGFNEVRRTAARLSLNISRHHNRRTFLVMSKKFKERLRMRSGLWRDHLSGWTWPCVWLNHAAGFEFGATWTTQQVSWALDSFRVWSSAGISSWDHGF